MSAHPIFVRSSPSVNGILFLKSLSTSASPAYAFLTAYFESFRAVLYTITVTTRTNENSSTYKPKPNISARNAHK